MTTLELTRRDVLRFRYRRHQLDREPGSIADAGSVDLLDYGVQDTGPDGAAWALEVRGATDEVAADVALAWTLRGAPHAYRRRDLGPVAVATAPLSEEDARKRIFDASKPLVAAGIDALDALRTVAGHMREIVDRPTVKGEVSRRLTDLVDDPYLRACRSCQAAHLYENPFRLAALAAGLELEPGTSPPVLRRIPRLRPGLYRRSGAEAEPRFDVVRNYLRFYGPARVGDAAAFLDSATAVMRDHWPADAVEVIVTDAPTTARSQRRFVLDEDVDVIRRAGAEPAPGVRLLGPYDPYLQLRDRDLLVGEDGRRKELWPVLGRPGAVAHDGEIVATWRPRTTGGRLAVLLTPWGRMSARTRALVDVEAQRLAAHRGADYKGLVDA